MGLVSILRPAAAAAAANWGGHSYSSTALAWTTAGQASDADASLQPLSVRPVALGWMLKPPTGIISRPQLASSRQPSGCQASSATAVSVEEPPVASDLASLKKDVLSIVAGLDRGLLAAKEEVSATDSAANRLEAAGGVVEFPEQLEKLQGKWKLVYSSAFASGNLGGSRPGPPAGRLPLSLGQVYQRIDTFGQEFDNIVDLRINLFWPLPMLEVTASLEHKFELIGKSGIRIVFERTRLKAGGGLSELPPVDLPQLPEFLRPPANSRSGQFEVTFLDDEFRITRGDRGELRIFLKV